MSCTYDTYREEIEELLKQSYTVKQIFDIMQREHNVFANINTLYYMMKKHNLVPMLKTIIKQICSSCAYQKTYYKRETATNVRVCTHKDHECVIKARYLPRWCNGCYKEKKHD